MHHLYPSAKGDPVCPLGFHPQVRWPTRCKRCFRDYKDHGGRLKDSDTLRKDETTVSSPSLSSWSSPSSRFRDDSRSSSNDSGVGGRGWSSSSSSNLSSSSSSTSSNSPSTEDTSKFSGSSRFGGTRPASSWTSTPDLGKLTEDTQADVTTVSLTLPRRRPVPVDTGQEVVETHTISRRKIVERSPPRDRVSIPPSASTTSTTVVTRRSRDAPKEESSKESSTTKQRRLQIQSLKEVKSVDTPVNPEVEFIIQVKKSSKQKQSSKDGDSSSSRKSLSSLLGLPSVLGSSSPRRGSSDESFEDDSDDDDRTSLAGTETTETTLIDRNENELQEQIDSLKQELDGMRARCERVEREKSDILLRRIAALDTAPSKTAASEVLKLQQRVNELQSLLEDLKDEKKVLTLKVKELEEEVEQRPDAATTKRTIDELRSKLLAAETLCEELMDENEDMKKELRDLEEEIEEMQDNFREEQADEYTSLRKELEQTAKNCRILSFKLRKAERKIEQIEAEKSEAERRVGGGVGVDRIKHLEQELAVSNELSKRLQKELEEANDKLKVKEDKDDGKTAKKKPPMLGVIGKTSSGEKISRESMTRGGSQEDPQQLLRDLQDSMEREADLREQLKYAEEEAQTYRKKASRMEDDNESLVLQLKKMATKARSRRHSPSPARLTPEPTVEKDEGIAEEEDPAELRILLELNEQETAVLRRKVEEIEKESEAVKRKNKELQDKVNTKNTARKTPLSSVQETTKVTPLQEKKIKILEEELAEIRKKLIEKERDCERLDSELTLTQKRYSKGSLQKTKSLDLINDQQSVDLKRQLQIIEQEASILRTRTQSLETENDKLTAENKRLQMLRGTKRMSPMKEMNSADNTKELQDKIHLLEVQLTEANNKVNELKGNLEEQEREAKLSELKNKPSGIKDTVETSKLKKELKSKADELEKIKTQSTKLESENNKLNESLNRLKEDAIANVGSFYKARMPKKPTDFTTKVQMKKMVDDLESEIGEILVLLKKAENEKATPGSELKSETISENEKQITQEKEELKKELETVKQKIEELTKEAKDEHDKFEKEKKKAIREKKASEENKKKLEEAQKSLEEEKKKWTTEVKKLEEAKKGLLDEKNKVQEENEKNKSDKSKLEGDIEKLKSEKDAATAKQEELPGHLQKIEALKKELEEETKQSTNFKKKVEALQKIEQEYAKVQKELTEKAKKITDIEKKMKEAEEKIKKNDITASASKTKISSLEKQLTEERDKAKKGDEAKSSLSSERESLKSRITELEMKTVTLEAELASKNTQIQTVEDKMREERARDTDASLKAGSAEKREMVKLREELDANINQVRELTAKLEKTEKTSKENEEKFKKTEMELNKSSNDLQSMASELEMDLQAERKKIERMKANQEKEAKNKETELASLKAKLRTVESSSGASNKKINEVREEYQAKAQQLESALTAERQEYEDLTAKYEILEEEHVVTKAQLVMEKEAMQAQIQSTSRELSTTENELRTLRETYNDKQDTWIKEKLDLQERLKELEEKASRNGEQATSRLKNVLEDKTAEIDQFKKEALVISDQMDYLRRENDELKKKLEDFDKVVKIHRNMTADTSAIDKELQETKNKLFQEEKSRKAEVAQLKLRYDSRVALISEEIQSLQNQVARFKRERDTFRHMLEGAQRTIADLKESPGKARDGRTSAASYDESEETRTKMASLEQQISCMEDELSEARLEASKLKTELVSERSAWEVKISEMQSKINELEEDRIVSSGRTKIPGLRTRMELAWHKEREEQHRLLQETSTLARDLRQTLFEVERERDKERLEAKRRLDLLKKTTEEEQDENRKKVTEFQCDLLELRDAHAKLRTTNEKLRREKERSEKEREEWRQMLAGKKRAEADEERKVNLMLEQIEELMRLAPDLFPAKEKDESSTLITPTPPRRLKGPKSRESSPALERKEFKKESSVDRQGQLQSTIQRLGEATEELRKYQRLNEEERDKDRARKTLGLRRAASQEADNPPDQSLRSKALNGKGLQKKGSLYRKSLSLEQTSGGAAMQQEQSIWKNDDETDGSLTSLQSTGSEAMDTRFFSRQRREPSLDSRLSGGSTQSEILPSSDKKKKKGILGKLKKLTKSRSIDDTNESSDFPMSASVRQGSDSDVSMTAEDKGSKKDLRDRLTGMFRKGGSRSSSVERSKKEESPALPDRSTSSLQRPLISGTASTLQRPSPARSDISQSSNTTRPLAQKKTTTTPSTSSTLPRRTK